MAAWTVPAAATATLLAAALAVVACLIRAVRRRGRLRVAWAALGLGALCCIAGAGRPAPLSPAYGGHPGYLGLVVAAIAGLLIMPPAARRAANRIRDLVDGLLIAVSLLLLSWNFVVMPALAAGAAERLRHPFADILLAAVALAVLARSRRGGPDGRGVALACWALAAIAVGHSAAARPSAPAALPPMLWLAGFAVLAFAAARPTHGADSGHGAGHSAGHGAGHGAGQGAGHGADEQPAGYRTAAFLLPYATVVTALAATMIWLASGGHPTAVGTWCRTVLLLLIMSRQVLILIENRHLTAELENRVAVRAAELHAREQRFRALIGQSSDCLAILEADSTVRYQSESIERIFGFPASALVGQRFIDVVGGEAGPLVAAAVDRVAEPGATTTFELMLRHRDGRHRLAEMTITNLLDDPNVHGLVFNTRDISDARELQDQLRHDAYHDTLTGLVNRVLFRERLATAVGEHDPQAVAVVFLDLDGFKAVNDSLGHAAGDQLLIRFAERLRRAVPEPHTVARLGGDEFAVIVISPLAHADAEDLAEMILAELALPILVDGRELHVGAGIGIASAADAGDVEQLQRNADLAMYRAKDAGGGQLVAYHPRMHDELTRRLELAADLRRALERDEFVLYYQPTVDIRTAKVVGFEALVRWQHPTRGMVPPLDFISAAEATGLIVPLGRWVLAEACRQAVAWGVATRPFRMAVNVSVRQFDAEDLAATVAEVLAETGMPAGSLVLEITESVLLTDTEENLSRIVRLKELGVLLALDDFGTGFSSLAYLQRFPMDVLKVDRSFVERLGGADEDEAPVRTIVGLGRSRGMVTVAEGIETEVQLDLLREIGCDVAQGYLLSRPLPAAEAALIAEPGRILTAGARLAAA